MLETLQEQQGAHTTSKLFQCIHACLPKPRSVSDVLPGTGIAPMRAYCRLLFNDKAENWASSWAKSQGWSMKNSEGSLSISYKTFFGISVYKSLALLDRLFVVEVLYHIPGGARQLSPMSFKQPAPDDKGCPKTGYTARTVQDT